MSSACASPSRLARACRGLALCLCLGASVGAPRPACAEEPPARPPSVPELAEQVRTAFEAGDGDALGALAAAMGQRAWVVADDLMAAGHAEAALALAGAWKAPAAADLVAYLESERTREPDHAAREAITRANAAFARRDLAAGLAALEGASGRGLAGVHIRSGRALALERLGRTAEAREEHLRRAADAAAVGWHHVTLRALEAAARLSERLGESERALALRRESLAAARRGGDEAVLAATLIDLGLLVERHGQVEEALALTNEGIEIARRIGHKAYLANGLVNRGATRRTLGRVEEARADLEEGRALQREVGNAVYAARADAILAHVELEAGNRERARTLLADALDTQERVGDAGAARSTLDSIARAYEGPGGSTARIDAARRVREIGRRTKSPAVEVHALCHHAAALRDAGAADAARDAAQEALALARAAGLGAELADALAEVSSGALHAGEFAASEEAAREALALAERLQDAPRAARALTLIGNALGRVGDGDGALAAHRRVFESLPAGPPSRLHAQAIGNLGYTHLIRGDLPQALEWTLKARDLYAELGLAGLATETLTNLAVVYLRMGDLDRAHDTTKHILDAPETGTDAESKAATVINYGATAMMLGHVEHAQRALEDGLARARAGARGGLRPLGTDRAGEPRQPGPRRRGDRPRQGAAGAGAGPGRGPPCARGPGPDPLDARGDRPGGGTAG